MKVLSALLILFFWAGIILFPTLSRASYVPESELPGQLVFVVRKQYQKDHHNTATIFQNGEINSSGFTPGAALKVLNTKSGETVSLLTTTSGVIRDPEVSFDGKKIIFSYRKNIKDDYHIYEINADGTQLKQLTFARGVSDIDPLYLSNNQLSGPFPASFIYLINLVDNNSDFCGNSLYTDDPVLRDFLNTKQAGGDWEGCQYTEVSISGTVTDADTLGTLAGVTINVNINIPLFEFGI